MCQTGGALNKGTLEASIEPRARWSGLLLVLCAALIYSALHVGFRLLASDVLGEEDVIDIVLVQDLRAGYDGFPRQPPLYDWVLWAVQQVLGPSLASFLVIKYLALIATVGFLYLAALRVLKDRLFAILSVEALALIYSIAWRYHEGFNHEILAMVAVMVTFWLFLRTIDYSRLIDFVLLGIGVGFGALTEPSYLVFFAALLLGSMLQVSMRRRLLKPELALTFVIAVAMASPYLLWLFEEPRRLSALWQPMVDYWSRLPGLLWDALRGPFAYLAPLIFILPLMFPRFLSTAWSDLKAPLNRSDEPDYERFILHCALISFGFCLLGAVVFSFKRLPIHGYMPFYLTSVVWLFGVARRAAGTTQYVKRFTRLALAIAVIALCARLANMFVLDPVCNICRWGIPYAGLAEEMRARGFENGTILSANNELAGNLRQLFPDSPIVTRKFPKFTPESVQGEQKGFYTAIKPRGKRVAIVWEADFSDRQVEKYLQGLLQVPWKASDADVVRVPWKHLWRPTGYRWSAWKVIILDVEDKRERESKRLLLETSRRVASVSIKTPNILKIKVSRVRSGVQDRVCDR